MELPKDFRKVLADVTNKRARFVIDTILSKGFCSTEDLKNAGYEHAPRAARDVRELGIYFIYYLHQQIEINHQLVNVVKTGRKKIFLCARHVIMHIQKIISILQDKKKKAQYCF